MFKEWELKLLVAGPNWRIQQALTTGSSTSFHKLGPIALLLDYRTFLLTPWAFWALHLCKQLLSWPGQALPISACLDSTLLSLTVHNPDLGSFTAGFLPSFLSFQYMSSFQPDRKVTENKDQYHSSFLGLIFPGNSKFVDGVIVKGRKGAPTSLQCSVLLDHQHTVNKKKKKMVQGKKKWKMLSKGDKATVLPSNRGAGPSEENGSPRTSSGKSLQDGVKTLSNYETFLSAEIYLTEKNIFGYESQSLKDTGAGDTVGTKGPWLGRGLQNGVCSDPALRSIWGSHTHGHCQRRQWKSLLTNLWGVNE